MKKLALLLLALTGSVQAATPTLHTVPTNWRVESYGQQGVVIWFAGTNCPNGQLTLPATATLTDHNRLYATIVSAKMANSKVFVIYNDATPSCTIVSYGAQ